MTTPPGKTSDAKIVLLIGITGHRDIRPQDTNDLNAAVERVLKALAAQYPHTPRVLISPLADGADRLVANVFLNSGEEVVAALPLPRETYVEDFSPQSRVEFEQMLAKCSAVYEMPLVGGATRESVAQHGPARNAQYAAVGAHIVRYSHLLLALWDGVDTGKTGGTWEIVKFRREGIDRDYDEHRSALDVPETGPVVQIVTPRDSNPTPVGEPFSIVPMGANFDERFTRLQLGKAFDRIDRFNQEVQQPDRRQEYPLVPAGELAAPLHAPLDPLERLHQASSRVAMRLQSRTTRTLQAIAICGIAATFCYRYADHASHRWRVAGLLVTFFALGWALYLWSTKWDDFQARYLDYRALAEALRVQYFWKLAAIGHPVTDFYLRKQRGMLQWIRVALSGVIHANQQSAVGADMAERLKLVRKHWIIDQRRYYAQRTLERLSQLDQDDNCKAALLVCGLLLSLVRLIIPGIEEQHLTVIGPGVSSILLGMAAVCVIFVVRTRQRHAVTEPEERRRDTLTRKIVLVLLSTGIALAFAVLVATTGEAVRKDHLKVIGEMTSVVMVVSAAVLHIYGHQRAFKEHARQYARMAGLFAQADQALTDALHAGDLAGAQKIIQEIGCEALSENADWLILHRERPIEAPTLSPH